MEKRKKNFLNQKLLENHSGRCKNIVVRGISMKKRFKRFHPDNWWNKLSYKQKREVHAFYFDIFVKRKVFPDPKEIIKTLK